MRKTKYARELQRAAINLTDGEEARIERLEVRDANQEEIRFSWWKNGRFVTRPLDLPEDDWIRLFEQGVRDNVFSPEFRARLREVL